jgi:hypothetical protein
MVSPCQPLPRSAAEETLQVVTRATRTVRGRIARDASPAPSIWYMKLWARDGVEYMLSRPVFGHLNLISVTG